MLILLQLVLFFTKLSRTNWWAKKNHINYPKYSNLQTTWILLIITTCEPVRRDAIITHTHTQTHEMSLNRFIKLLSSACSRRGRGVGEDECIFSLYECKKIFHDFARLKVCNTVWQDVGVCVGVCVSLVLGVFHWKLSIEFCFDFTALKHSTKFQVIKPKIYVISSSTFSNRILALTSEWEGRRKGVGSKLLSNMSRYIFNFLGIFLLLLLFFSFLRKIKRKENMLRLRTTHLDRLSLEGGGWTMGFKTSASKCAVKKPFRISLIWYKHTHTQGRRKEGGGWARARG